MSELKKTEREEESKKSIGVANNLTTVILLIALAGLLYLILSAWLGISLP